MELPIFDRQLTLYEEANKSLQGNIVIPKSRFGILTLWFGRHSYDDDLDYGTFQREAMFSGLRKSYVADFYIPDAGEAKDRSSYCNVAPDIARELDSNQKPLAVFIITTPKVAELHHIDQLPQGVFEHRLTHTPHPTFIYKVIFGYGFSGMTYEDFEPFSENELRARQHGGVFLPFNTDYPSVSCRRAVDVMERILGYDLPGDAFPNYTPEEIEKITWNANREDFNTFSPRAGAIPKYHIENGRPVFPF